jgi:DNA-binding transcriptional ArsR family regulator
VSVEDSLLELTDHEKIRKGASLLKAISHPIRLCLVLHLAQNQELNVSWFVNCMGASQSSVSQHLAQLRHLGIVSARQAGQMQYYRLENKLLGEIAISAVGGKDVKSL